MTRLCATAALSVVVALYAQQTGIPRMIQDTRALVTRAEASSADSAERKQALSDAADKFESLAANRFSPELLRELRQAASTLRQEARASKPTATAFSAAPYIHLLERATSESTSGPLEFQGSYSQPKVTEPVYGGHGSAMGPPPVDARTTSDSNVVSPATFEEVPCIPTRTFCGGRSKDHILESGGSGVALFDYDGDGLLDIYVVTAFELSDQREKIAHHNALYKNEGNWRFRDVSKDSGLDAAAWGNGVCAGDYDNDGKLDLYVTNFGPNFLFKNNGDGTFTDKAASSGAAGSGWSTGCAFFDADGDGDLDLYVARYVSTSWADLAKAERTLVWRGGPKTMVGPKGMPGEADLFFENRGDGTFVEAAEAHGLSDAAGGYGFGVIATDYDNDGGIDLFVANDTTPNFLYRNRGNGRFESVGLASGVALNQEGRAQAGMGVDAADYDGDGRVDLIVTNFAQDVNTLYRNLDGQQFEDVTAAAGLAGPTFPRMGWGTAFFDADLDGMVDLFFANGHIYPNVDEYPQLQETYRQKNQLLLNRSGRFVDVSATAGGGLQVAKSSRGLAVGDLDNDGDLDLVVSNMDDVPTVLENRQQTGHHWVAIQLAKAGMNRFCIGARVTVEAGGRRQVRDVRSGGGYLSQNDLRAFYGLGAFTGAVDVEVRMPGGATWRWQAQPIDRVLKLTLDDTRDDRR
jgi:hypothetical protein